MISNNTIESVKARMEVFDVVSDHVKLKKHGINFTGLCPFHNEKTPSFTVSKQKNIYKCFGCGKSGDAITFLIEHERVDYIAAIKILAEKYNIEIEEDGREPVKPVPRLEKLSKEVIAGFEQRGISNNTLLRFNITEAVEWMPGAQKEVKAMCFNYYRGDDLINIKFRAKGKDFKLAKDAELIFYNLNAVEDETTAVIVEGEIDCLSMYESGIYNCVSVPNGASKGVQRLQYLDNCYHYFRKLQKVIICVDNDEPGHLLREELGRRLGKEKCWLVSYPEGCKDANDVLIKYGKKAVVDLVETAKQWPIEGIIHVEDLDEEVVDFYENGYPRGAKAHVQGFDNYMSFVEGQLTTITGIPGHGKDEFLNLVMIGLAKYENWAFGVCGFEEPAGITITKLQEKYTGKAFDFRKDPQHRMNNKEFIDSFQFLKKYFYFINQQIVGANGEAILDKAAELVERYGIKGLVINPWNWLEHMKQDKESETEYVSRFLTQLLNFAVKYGVHIFLVAHPTKMIKDKQTKKYEVPTLYNISGSANFYNKTYNGITVYRDTETNHVDVYVQKIKWSWLGRLGFTSFEYNTYTRQYQYLSESHPAKDRLIPIEQTQKKENFLPFTTLPPETDESDEGDMPF